MATQLTASAVNLKTDEILLTVFGTLEGTVSSIIATVIDPDSVSYTVNISPDNVANPTALPFTFTLTPELLGLTTTYFQDGVYSVTLAVDYSDATDESIQDYVLMANRAKRAWKDWIELTACLNGGCGCDDCGTTISSVREQIQAAVTFYENSEFTSARQLLTCAYEEAKNKIN